MGSSTTYSALLSIICTPSLIQPVLNPWPPDHEQCISYAWDAVALATQPSGLVSTLFPFFTKRFLFVNLDVEIRNGACSAIYVKGLGVKLYRVPCLSHKRQFQNLFYHRARHITLMVIINIGIIWSKPRFILWESILKFWKRLDKQLFHLN